MENNVIYLSDASFDPFTKEAGLGIKNLYTGFSDEELIATFMPLTNADTYGYLCAISGAAPMPKPLPSNLKGVNEKIISLLMHVGSKTLIKQLSERFKATQTFKYRAYESLLETCGFSMEWFQDAKQECGLSVAA
ncbi:MAG TPA: hypothetical protein PLM93_11505 [Sulfuricurvum sp.]|nr:MAG: hypothetical protein B7Y30_06800 [Campylobacterales bacterium 16-40-21]OYZ59360.1 MAG: hypothetical protein B7Y17_05520 [Sulfuricurvum sp. 24-42-5]OZA02208.1 MAG: hypothetical protein B7X89_10265 [Sulfuricurvum sp. 17-40-25]HQS67800.1 hypothetical protein [Sulfuricurvum sp.]HQT36303.1 hypothetical protein [Sulfuricurvum sp.]